MTIRRATRDDVDAVAALERETFGPDAWSRAMVEEEFTGSRRRAWVTDDLTGYAVVLDGEVVELLRIAVSTTHRRRGLATRLLAAASGEGRMLLEVSAANDTALAFYAAEGFVEIDRRRCYYRDGTDAIVMERKAT